MAAIHTSVKNLLTFVPPNTRLRAHSCINSLNMAISELATAMTMQASQISSMRDEVSSLCEDRQKALSDVRTANNMAAKAHKGLKAMQDGFPEWLQPHINSVITENLAEELPSYLQSSLDEACQQLQ